MTGIDNNYENFIAVSRYARWREKDNRRETWGESVDRYVDFMIDHVKKNYDVAVEPSLVEEIRANIFSRNVMPSMRALMTAGPALARDNVAGFNCSFLPVNSPRSFDEAMYILMCGTGVGFSVEAKYIAELPPVSEHFERSNTVIAVEDSKSGWARAYRELLALLWQGQIPEWDVSKVRPRGARLKTFGGRASGPEPLEDLFKFSIKIFTNAAGRHLKPIEAHDLMCKVGDIVVVGGVRRSALISLSDLEDFEMAKSKAGTWWESEGQRRLANNSAVYNTKPSIGQFLREWGFLYESNSGERGIFNKEGIQRHASSSGRRDGSKAAGTNPCLSADSWVITDLGPRRIADIIDTPTQLALDGELNVSSGFFWTGKKNVYNLKLDNGMSVKATLDHKFMTSSGWKQLSEITVADSVRLSVNKNTSWSGEGGEDEGYIIGLLVGDETFGSNACIDIWDNGDNLLDRASEALTNIGITPNFTICTQVGEVKKWRMSSVEITRLAAQFGVVKGAKLVNPLIEFASSDFYSGFLRGYFDADGSMQGNRSKGLSVRLSSSDEQNLLGTQRMLSRLGVLSKVYVNRRQAQFRMLPDSDRELTPYECRANHELIISRDAIKEFSLRVGFGSTAKSKRLADALTGSRDLYKTSSYSQVSSISYSGLEDVYDAQVPNINAFDANGLYTHNCGEIILRDYQFCNLTEVIIRPEDTQETLARKVELAAIIGTWQSSLTNFKYIRKIWKDNSEEERLLGVSLTGQFGNELTSGKKGMDELISALETWRSKAISANSEWAGIMGIQASAAITTVKPSGTVSQLTGVSSGMHPWHDKQYLRTVRCDSKDAMAEFLKDSGVYWEPDAMSPETSLVFYFPIKAPEGAVTRDELTAIQHLEIWKVYKKHWTEHNPSITVSVREHEWIDVAAWVYDNWEDVGGIAFLPYSDHVYKQAPYTQVSAEEFADWEKKNPTSIDWSALSFYETEDGTTGSQELACSAGSCDVVDVKSAVTPVIVQA